MMLRAPAGTRVLRPSLAAGRPHVVVRAPAAGRRGRGIIAAAGKEDSDKAAGDKKEKEVADYVEALQRGGLKKEMAQEVLKKWQEEAGADASDPKVLRKLFLKQSAVPAIATIVQTLFDAAAGYSIFTSAIFFAAGPDFTGRGVLVFLLNCLAAYFAVGVAFDFATLTAILISTARVGTSVDSFYAALKVIAGPGGGAAPTGLAVVDKAVAAANALKVAQALDAIAKMLDGTGAGGKEGTQSTLSNLSAYLTLQRSEARDGFDPAKIGLTEAEAADVALKFSQYDLNDDGRIDSGEMRAMAGQLGIELSSDDAAAAITAMDKNGDGLIEFSEFAEFFAARRKK